jgi:hypothetical protein
LRFWARACTHHGAGALVHSRTGGRGAAHLHDSTLPTTQSQHCKCSSHCSGRCCGCKSTHVVRHAADLSYAAERYAIRLLETLLGPRASSVNRAKSRRRLKSRFPQTDRCTLATAIASPAVKASSENNRDKVSDHSTLEGVYDSGARFARVRRDLSQGAPRLFAAARPPCGGAPARHAVSTARRAIMALRSVETASARAPSSWGKRVASEPGAPLAIWAAFGPPRSWAAPGPPRCARPPMPRVSLLLAGEHLSGKGAPTRMGVSDARSARAQLRLLRILV